MFEEIQYVTCGQMKRLEEEADAAGLSYYQMMENAGKAAADYIMSSQERCVVEVFCGKGNNGGDGFVVARELYKAGYQVTVILVEGEPTTIDAGTNYELIRRLPIEIIDMNNPGSYLQLFSQAPQIIVDGIYGTGFRGELMDNGLRAVMYINKHKVLGTKVVALDIPSGLKGDVMEVNPDEVYAVRADLTVAFHAGKPVHIADNAEFFCGKTIIVDIGIDDALCSEQEQEPESPEVSEIKLTFDPPVEPQQESEVPEIEIPSQPEASEMKVDALAEQEKPVLYMGPSPEKLKKLEEILNSYGSVLVALSGGVDSIFLLVFAYRLWRDDRVAAVTAVGPHFSKEETDYARGVCDKLGISNKTFDAEYVLSMIKNNDEDRCYYCKQEIFSAVKNMAQMAGSVPVDGTNLDDMNDYRPGYRAVQEQGVASPLKEAGFTKEDIRNGLRQIAAGDESIAKALALEEAGRSVNIWEKPAFACLASRIPYGEEITERKLDAVKTAEQWLKARGFSQIRVRCHEIAGTADQNMPALMARIELLPEEIEDFLRIKDDAENSFRRIGFSYVTLDLGGYKKGSLNRNVVGYTDPEEEKLEALHKKIDDFIRETEEKEYTFSDLVDIIGKLRAPDGCPWDREQTHESLKKHLIEETKEALAAIDEGDSKHLCEELGDVLLQVVLHAQIASEAGEFTIGDVIKKESAKMIRRHPHVFGDIEVAGLEDQLNLWEEIKKREKLLAE